MKFDELGAGFLQAEIHAPKSVTRDQKLDRYAEDTALRGAAGAYNTGPKCLAREEVRQIEVAAYAGVRLHLQQAALGVYLYGFNGFFYVLTASLLPLRLYGNNDGKTDAPPFFCLCRRTVR